MPQEPERRDSGFSIERTDGQVLCPDCGRAMSKHRTVLRKVRFFKEGKPRTCTFELETFRCKRCGHSHRLLPAGSIVPYKHYSLDTIVQTLDEGEDAAIPVEGSTMARWKGWAQKTVTKATAFLRRVWLMFSHPLEQMPVLSAVGGTPGCAGLPVLSAWGLMADRRGWRDRCLVCIFMSMRPMRYWRHEAD